MSKKNFNNKKRNVWNHFNLFLHMIFLLIIKNVINDCPKNAPILISGQCQLKHCSKAELDSGYCNINNTFIKTQWLNNIIQIGGLNYRYINIASYSNGDMVIETTCYPGEPKRYFYGLKRNGRPFFTKKYSQEETPYYLKETYDQQTYHKGKYEAEAIVIKSSESGEKNGKEYFLSVSKLDCYAELFDFKNDKIYYKTVDQFTQLSNIKTFRHAFFPYKNYNNNYYYFFGFTSDTNPDINQNLVINFQKHIFSSITSFSTRQSLFENTQTIQNGYGKIISSFQTPSGLIICFFLIKTDKIYFNIRKYDVGFTNPIDYKFESNIPIEEIFYKCIHLKGEIGAFSYYKYIDYIPYPFILFKEFNKETQSFDNFLPNKYVNSEIALKVDEFFFPVLLNDFIKINDNKICLVNVLTDRETVYIILFNIFGEKQIKIRYYSIPTFSLYNYKILFDLRAHNYNNFIAFASSYCNNQKCDDNNDQHYSGFMVFSYPNSTDSELNLEEYLFNNDFNFKKMEIDLKKNLIFQNNIFGYILSNIMVYNISDCGEYKLFSSYIETKEIISNTTLDLDENIKLQYEGTGIIYPIIECKIQYYFIATEPDLKIYDTYPDAKEGDEDNDEFFKKEKYNGRLTNYIIKLNQELTSDCSNNCDLCLNNQKEYCIACKFNYTFAFEDGKNSKICFDKPNIKEIISDTNSIGSNVDDNTELLSNNFSVKCKTNEIIKEELNTQSINIKPITEDNNKSDKKDETYICTNEDILKNKCKTIIVSEIQINDLNEIIKKEYLSEEYNRKNNIIETKNIIFQITTLDKQNDPINHKEISIIDLGECQQILKAYYHIPEEESLIIYKTDIKTSNLVQSFIQYEIYNPLNLEKLSLSICDNTTITISSVIHLDNETIALYNSLSKSGYNLFDAKDSFYNDVCTAYTTQKGTDMILEDRKKEVFEIKGNISLCQKGCKIKDFNSTTQEIKCKCSPQINEIEALSTYSDDKFIVEILKDRIFTTITNSHISVLKCYKLAFEIKNILKNIGRIIMTIIVVLSFIFLFIFFFIDFKKIDTLLLSILNNKKYSNNQKRKRKNKIYKNRSSKKRILNIKNQIEKNDFGPPKRTNLTTEKKSKTIILNNSQNDINVRDISNVSLNKKREIKEFKKNIINNKTNINIIKIKNLHIKKYRKKKKQNSVEKNNISIHKGYLQNKSFFNNNLKDQELNELKYESAIELDKRSFCQFYFSLLKKNQLILFTFCSSDDYNLFSIKVCLFLTNFSLYLTMNCLFFNDNLIHKIFLDNGAYRIIYQLPNIIYTSIISITINLMLKLLSLSENKLLQIKKTNSISLLICKDTKRCLKIKFIFFFIINYLFLLFFWYYISCFSGVFVNTQITLFIDALFSFSLSLLYPFGYDLIPGAFRILSLRDKKKDKKYLYDFGRIISLN